MRQPYGQNFLIDKNVAKKIIDSAELKLDDVVIEIGPGRGFLTSLIIPKVKKLIAIEIDPKLVSNLKNCFKDAANFELANQNALTYPLSLTPYPYKIVANLPYYIATAMIEKILTKKDWTEAILMIQKEVAERITAKTGTKDYGYFTILCQYFANCKKLFDVSASCFKPKPKVESTVIKLTNRNSEIPDENIFKIIKIAFQQRRKNIANALSKQIQCPKEELLRILTNLGIDKNTRPEKLSFSDYKNLTYLLKKYIIN